MNNIPVFDMKKISKKYNKKLNMLRLKSLSYSLSVSNLPDKNKPYTFILKGTTFGIYEDGSRLNISSIDKIIISTRESEDKMRKLFMISRQDYNTQFTLFGRPLEYTINKVDSFRIPSDFIYLYQLNDESQYVLHTGSKDYDVRIYGDFIHK